MTNLNRSSAAEPVFGLASRGDCVNILCKFCSSALGVIPGRPSRRWPVNTGSEPRDLCFGTASISGVRIPLIKKARIVRYDAGFFFFQHA